MKAFGIAPALASIANGAARAEHCSDRLSKPWKMPAKSHLGYGMC